MNFEMNAKVNPMSQQTLVLELGGPAHGGTCVARDADGRVVFVRYGLPGERVRVAVVKEQSNLAWAEVVEVIRASPDRNSGTDVPEMQNLGADLAHVRPAAVLRWKQQVLNSTLRRIGGKELSAQIKALYGDEGPQVGGTAQSDETDQSDGSGNSQAITRTRARFVVDELGRLGMRKYRSSQIIRAAHYPFLSPIFEEAGIFDEGPRGDSWRNLWAPGDVVTLVEPNGSEPLVVVGERAFTLNGQKAIYAETLWQVSVAGMNPIFEVAPTGFWQIHPQAPTLLVQAVMDACGPIGGSNVIELYSGAGLFSYFLAAGVGPEGKLLTLEGSEAAVKDAERNLREVNQNGNVEFFQGRVTAKAVADLAVELGGIVDLVVLDPPRAGAKRHVASAVADTGAEKIVLVACDPAAAARDLAYFVSRGYQLQSLQAWDIFPNNHHFEVVAQMRRPEA